MNKFTKNIEDVYYPPIVKFKAEAAKRLDYSKPVLNLNQAVPNYQPPDVIKKAIKKEVDNPSFGFYTFDEGIPQLREAVAEESNSRYSRKIEMSNICIVPGANNGFYSIIPVIAQAGDEIIILSPYYFNHIMTLKILGIKPVEIQLDPAESFDLPFEKIRNAVTDRTRAVILVNPSNPTGRSYTQDEVNRLYSICRNAGIYLISDEVYSYFHDNHPNPASVLNIDTFPENAVCINSYSKTFSITGLRVGYITASQEFIHHFTKIQDSNVVCVSTLSQAAALAGVKEAKEWLEEKIGFSRNKKDIFIRMFKESSAGFNIISSGSFFIYLNYESEIKAPELCYTMMEKENVVALPGDYFGSGQDYSIRIALGNLHEHEIPSAVEKLARISRLL